MAATRTDGVLVGTVAALRRFPVKSTSGETLEAAPLDERGFEHDRVWAAYTADGGIASGKTTRRFRRVAGLTRWSSYVDAGCAVLAAPDGTAYDVRDPRVSEALTVALGRPLTLRREGPVRHHDDAGVHLVTSTSMARLAATVGADVDPRRTRANIVLDTTAMGLLEDAWTGGELALGRDVVLGLGPAMPRCVMLDQPQVGVPAEPPALRSLGLWHDLELGLMAEVVRAGAVGVGDEARLLVTTEAERWLPRLDPNRQPFHPR